MLLRLNLFLWLHLIPRKFHFQFQSNPDDKYQPAPFHRKWKITVSILFFLLRGLWGVRERHVLPKRERLLVLGQKKTKYDIFLEKIWKENFVLWVFHLETLRALPSEFQIGRRYSLLFLILQISTIYPILRS